MRRKKSPPGTGRLGRDKKLKAMQSDQYKLNMEKLLERGITENDIQMILDRCSERKQTRIVKDTLAFKLVELLEYFDERNNGISVNDDGFISKDDVINMVMKNPRIITSDIRNNIITKCQVITNKKGTIKEANMAIKTNPGIFRKAVQTIIEGK